MPSIRRFATCMARAALFATLFGVYLPNVAAQPRMKQGTPEPEIYVGVIVKYKASAAMRATATSASSMRTLEGRARVKIAAARAGALNAFVYRFAESTPPAEARAAAARLALDPDVEYAVPDQMMRATQVTPNDSAYAEAQWHLHSPVSVIGGANLPLAWQRTTGSTNVVVAVVDSGIRPAHPDLAGRLLPGYDFVSGDIAGLPQFWLAADGDGRDTDPTDPGDYVDAALLSQLPPGHGFNTNPSSWHGTHVAGTIGAASNNALGVTGVDWGARILPVRALGRGGSGMTSDILDAIAWAAGLSVPGVPANPNPARVINLSLSGSGACDAANQDVINQVRAVGAIVVVATGNESSTVVGQPANCNGVIAVTAHAPDGDNAVYANVGPQVAVSAPGGGCGSLSVLDPDNGALGWASLSCAGCHSSASLRAQIQARAPSGLTYTKALAALNAALTGTDLDGVATGMAYLSTLTVSQRSDLAANLSLQTCAGPADGVYSTVNLGTSLPAGDGYGGKVGTSMAAPHVSGVVGLMLSLSPQLSADEVRSVLQSTARPHPPGSYCVIFPGTCGAGLLDAAAAVAHVANNRPTVTATVMGSTTVRPGTAFSINSSAQAQGGRGVDPASFRWRQTAGTSIPILSVAQSINVVAPSVGGMLGFEVSAADMVGYSAVATTSVAVNAPPSMTAAGPFALTAGTAGSGSIAATDPEGDAITYVMTSSPPGLTLSAATGQWNWTPSAPGTFSMTVVPVDGLGNGAATTYTFNVAAATPTPGAANPPTGGGGGGGAITWWVALLMLLTVLAPEFRHGSPNRRQSALTGLLPRARPRQKTSRPSRAVDSRETA